MPKGQCAGHRVQLKKGNRVSGEPLTPDKDKDPTIGDRDGSSDKDIINVCLEDIGKNVDSVRSEFRAWTSSMRAPSEIDDGGALSFKTQFVHFMKNGKHG